MAISARDKIGTFKGIPVYETTVVEYVNKKYYETNECMFLIDKDLIYKNELFGKYDGYAVELYDPHERAVFYTIPIEKPKSEAVSKTETEIAAAVEETTARVLDVEETLKGVYDTDYFSGMIDVDAFLKSALES